MDAERFAIEAPAAAHIAQHLYVGQEVHLDRAQALAFAPIASPAAGVERKTRGRVAAYARLGGVGKQLANRVPESNVGRRARARCLADRCLVDLEHAIDL